MTIKQLENKVSIGALGHGSYKITIDYRNKEYHCHSNNSTAYDRISEHKYGESDYLSISGVTYRQALQSLWDECVRKNDLPEAKVYYKK